MFYIDSKKCTAELPYRVFVHDRCTVVYFFPKCNILVIDGKPRQAFINDKHKIVNPIWDRGVDFAPPP